MSDLRCMHCGDMLSIDFDWDRRNNRMYRKCQKCRQDMTYNEERIQNAAKRRQEKREREERKRLEKKQEEWKREGRVCIRCGYPLRAIYRAYRVCGKCMREDEEREKRRITRPERMRSHCYSCPFKQFYGEFYSCISAAGTGPMTKDCLKYTAGGYLRMNIKLEDEDE